MRIFPNRILIVAIGAVLALSVARAQTKTQNLDSETLSDLLNVKILSASNEAEPWAEAPVPMTVITANMIKKAGIRTLKEALIDFVPGYTNSQDRNEILFATRGLYATSQQKVLIMINGHRLNSRSYEAGMPDYGLDLQDIQRIEVLRGPGSSLYGNVALAGVINLITKKGRDVNGTSVDVSAGNWGQRRVRFLTGSGNSKYDFLGWGQYYTASGELHHVVNGTEPYNPNSGTGDIYIDRVSEPAAHDVGINYKHGHWTFFGASRTSSYGEPYGTNSQVYSLGDYRLFDDAGPGLSMSEDNFGVKYNHNLGSNWSLEVNPYYDHSKIQAELSTNANGGAATEWNDQDLGMIVQGTQNYGKRGNLLVGAQVETFQVPDSLYLGMSNGDFTGPLDSKSSPLLDLGSENSYSAFAQDKYRFSNEWILNAGARYDYKERRTGPSYDNLSPRLAMIYLPNSNWENKLVYSQSFEDAPYWYRYNHIPTFSGSSALDPELLSAIQYQNVWTSSDKTKRNAVTLYYQNAHNLVAKTPDAPPAPQYANAGRIESVGLEEELAWQLNALQIFWEGQYDYALSTIDYQRFGSSFAHVPNLASSLVMNYSVNHSLTANVTVVYTGDEYYNSGTESSPIQTKVNGSAILNIGAHYSNPATKGWTFDGRIYNVMNTVYYQGGQVGTQVPFRQAGRWWMLTVGRTF